MLESVGIVCAILSVIMGVVIGAKASVDAIYGYLPSSYGIPAISSWIVAFVCTILSAGGLWFIGVGCFLVFVGLAAHLHQIRGPYGWYDSNTDPPPRKTDNSLKDLE